MKTTVVIPSYWSRKSALPWKSGDAVYDHPTPINRPGTLLRALKSINRLKDSDFNLVLIAAPTCRAIGGRAEKRVMKIARSARMEVRTFVFGPSQLIKLRAQLSHRKGFSAFLNIYGYSNVRNLCLLVPHILDSDAVVFIDEDEIEDPGYLSKARRFIGKKNRGREINALAGYYIQPGGGYHLKKASRPWMRHWGQVSAMNKAFSRMIRRPPRLKKSPFVFGGNMVIHRRVFTKIPFDPNIHRGEDIDYLIDARMFGFVFWLYNKLSIKHQPPPKAHPTWMQLREDIYRFVYERETIRSQFPVKGMTRVRPGDFDPYPGLFLRNDLEQRIKDVCKLLSKEYLSRGDRKASSEALRNIRIMEKEAVPRHDPFRRMLETQKRWEHMIKHIEKKSVRPRLKAVVKTGEV